MPRSPAQTDFPVDVPGIGTFTFARRTNRDRFRIQAESSRLSGCLENPPSDLAVAAEAFATLSTLMVDAPDGFTKLVDMDALDPLDPASDQKILAVFLALRKKEESFRARPLESGEAAREGNGHDAGVLVP